MLCFLFSTVLLRLKRHILTFFNRCFSFPSFLVGLRTKADILLAYISTCLQHLKELNRIEIRQSSRGISYAISVSCSLVYFYV